MIYLFHVRTKTGKRSVALTEKWLINQGSRGIWWLSYDQIHLFKKCLN